MQAFAFRDLMGPAGAKPIRVLARISVLRTEEGGRKQPFTDHYRPNHNFGGPEDREFYVGQVEVSKNTWIYPGETRDLPITFLNGPGLADLLQVGRKWRIREGRHHVATAEALELLDDKT